jgi:hypothetical protein
VVGKDCCVVIYTDGVGETALLDQRADATAGLSQCQSGNRGDSDQGPVHLREKGRLESER